MWDACGNKNEIETIYHVYCLGRKTHNCAKHRQPHLTTLWPGRSFAQQLSRIFPLTKVRSDVGKTTPESANPLPSISIPLKIKL